MTKILLFDVDGTIAESGQNINPCIKDLLLILSQERKCEIGIVGGGKHDKIKSQLDGLEVTHLFSESGCVYHLNDTLQYMKSIRAHDLYPKINELIKKTLEYLSRVDYVLTGNFIDLRNGIVYISMIGMCANQEERKYFMELNKKYKYREELIHILKLKSKDLDIANKLEIVEGGNVGIGVYPTEWDKIQVLEHFHPDDEIYYFGDKYTSVGNDYKLLSHPRVKGYAVDNPDDTFTLLSNIFPIW